MGIRWLYGRVGIRIQDFFGTVRESIGDWASALASAWASAGVGAVGDTIGAAAAPSTTTARTSPIAIPSSIVMVFGRTARTSVVPETSALRQEHVPALLAESIIVTLRDRVPSGDSPVLAV